AVAARLAFRAGQLAARATRRTHYGEHGIDQGHREEGMADHCGQHEADPHHVRVHTQRLAEPGAHPGDLAVCLVGLETPATNIHFTLPASRPSAASKLVSSL